MIYSTIKPCAPQRGNDNRPDSFLSGIKKTTPRFLICTPQIRLYGSGNHPFVIPQARKKPVKANFFNIFFETKTTDKYIKYGYQRRCKELQKSACVIRTVVIQSRQMKEVPVRHLSPYSGFGSYCTSFFVTERKDMEQHMFTLRRQILLTTTTLTNTAFGSTCLNALLSSVKYIRIYLTNSIYRHRGRSLSDLTFV